MPGVFINYRTGDDAYAASLVDQRLCKEFGADAVFRDRRSLRPGVDFPPELSRRLNDSTVLLALIGPRWLTLTDSSGNRRLDNARDYVRREIRRCIKRGIPVIPVLLSDAHLPSADDLPDDLGKLPRFQAVSLRVHESEQDLDHLVQVLAAHLPRSAAAAPTASGNTVHIQGHRVEIRGDVIGGNRGQ